LNPSARNARFWLWPNLLSLDAPIVAVLWQMLFVRCFHAEWTATASALLVLAVWLIYAADRVFDARGESELPRHEFYRRNWRRVAPVWIAGFAFAGWLAWTQLPHPLFERGLVLLGAVGIYFALVHLTPVRKWPKEAAVAILFALGASLAAWGHVRSAVDAATILLFSCLCWINCVAIEKWEHRESRWPVGLAALCVAAAALLLLYPQRPVLGAAEAASGLAFVLLDQGRDRFSRDALRVLADVALLSPIFFLPIAGTLT
jgi:hypothetical protein